MAATNDTMTPAELAEETKRTPQAVSRWIHDGIRGLPLPMENDSGRILIRRSTYERWKADIAALMKQRRPRKKPKRRSAKA